MHICRPVSGRNWPCLLRLTLVTTSLVWALSGCGGNITKAAGTPVAPVDYLFLTGNWVFTATSTAGPAPFTTLVGFVNEQSENPGTYDIATAALQAQPATTCYVDAVTVPLQGSVVGTAVSLSSFSVNGQYLNITGTKDASSTHLTGTYAVSKGCAKGAKGNITGTRLDSLTGVYSGAFGANTPSETMQLTLSQDAQGTGDGRFFVSGTAAVNGVSCFTSATLSATSGYVLGNIATLAFATNEPSGSTLTVTGTFDQAASMLTAQTVQVTGGGCSGTYGATTLAVQP